MAQKCITRKKSFSDFNHNLNPTTRHGLENLKHFYKTPTICVHQTNVYLEKQLKSTSDKKNYFLFFFSFKNSQKHFTHLN